MQLLRVDYDNHTGLITSISYQEIDIEKSPYRMQSALSGYRFWIVGDVTYFYEPGILNVYKRHFAIPHNQQMIERFMLQGMSEAHLQSVMKI